MSSESSSECESKEAVENKFAARGTGALRARLAASGFDFTDRNVELRTHIETEHASAGLHFTGMAFYLFVNEKLDPRFIYGSVGKGNTLDEARKSALSEWGEIFLPTFVNAATLSGDYLVEGSFRLYASRAAIRGDSPPPLGDHRTLALNLIRPYMSFVQKTHIHGTRFLLDAQVILLTMAVQKDGHTEGRWVFNGQPVALVADAKTIGLPLTEAGYSLKELFIFRGSNVA